MRVMHFIIVLGLLIASGVSAQEQEPEVSMRFRVFLWPNDLPIALLNAKGDVDRKPTVSEVLGAEGGDLEVPVISYFSQGDSGVSEIPLNEGVLSSEFTYRGPVEMRFFQRPPADGASDSNRQVVARTNLDLGMKNVVLFFFAQGNERYKVLPVSLGEIGGAENGLVINISTDSLRCLFGRQEFVLKSGERYRYEMLQEETYYQPMLVVSKDERGITRRRLAQKLSMSKKELYLILIYNRADRRNSFNLLKIEVPESRPDPA